MSRQNDQANGCLGIVIFIIMAICTFIAEYWKIILISIGVIIILVCVITWWFRRESSRMEKNYREQEKIRKQEKPLDEVLKNCKQKGTVEDIKKLNALAKETSIFSLEYFELYFSIAQIYNFLDKSQDAQHYFRKVKDMTARFSFEDMQKEMKKFSDKEDFYGALYLYTYLLEYKKNGDIRENPDMYYNRALIYWKTNDFYNKNKAIADINKAIEKVSEKTDSSAKEQLDTYYYTRGQIYKDLKKYSAFLDSYEQIPSNSPLYNQVQEEIIVYKTECAEAKYKDAQELYGYENYKNARKAILEAIKLANEVNLNKAKYEKLLQKIKEGIEQEKERAKEERAREKEEESQRRSYKQRQNVENQTNSYQKRKETKIDITKCSKKDILELDCFDSELAARFIKERDNGRMWYNAEDLWSFFGLDLGNDPVSPLAEIEEKIIFPAKPRPTMGRRLDW